MSSTVPSEPVSTATRQHKPRVFGLDLIRAAAILSVVFSHGFLAHNLRLFFAHGWPSLQPLSDWIVFTEHLGALGVEIFFVLSGFLIGTILVRSSENFGPKALGGFFIRRWFRTLPLFWLFVVLNVWLEAYLRSRDLSAGDIGEVAFFLRNLTVPTIPFFPESWSLAVEEWFYVAFPILLLVAYKLTRGRRPLEVFLAVALGLLTFSLVMRCVYATRPGADWVTLQRCAVLLRFDAIMTGVVAAWVRIRFPRAWEYCPRSAAVLGLVVFLGGYATIWDLTTPNFAPAVDGFYAKTFRFSVISLGVALMLPAASLWRIQQERLPHRCVRSIAVWSYAMYLVNWPLFQLLSQPWSAPLRANWWSENLYFFKQLSLIAISALLYKYYERPLTQLREYWSNHGKDVHVALASPGTATVSFATEQESSS